jgi:uncharacterized membrane protein YbhN (UPF0104 family)
VDGAVDERDVANTRTRFVRTLGATAITLVLVVAVWSQRDTIGSALSEIRRLPALALATLMALTVYERWSRGDIVRRLLGEPIGIGRALTIHDVGTAASKGVPLGGALGTALRWSISRKSGVQAPVFATMLVAYGIATTFTTWLLPFVALLVDLTRRAPDTTDLLLLVVIAGVLIGSAGFWTVVLRSERLETWTVGRTRRVWGMLARRVPALDEQDPGAGVTDVRRELLRIARRPWGLLGRTMLAQACGAIILLVSLRALGVGSELGVTEFFRVFFLAHLAGTFAPTPGGVGVVEAGTTGALMAAGVETTTALAGVIVYRFLTYVVPIMFGALLYLGWRVRNRGVVSTTLAAHGASFDTAVPDLPCSAHQGLREHRHAR